MNSKKTIIVAGNGDCLCIGEMLKDSYIIIANEDINEAIDSLRVYGIQAALIILDTNIKNGKTGHILELIDSTYISRHTPIVLVCTENNMDIINRAVNIGAVDFIERPFNSEKIQQEIKSIISYSERVKKLKSDLYEEALQNEKGINVIANVVSHILEFKNRESELHVHNVRLMAELLANEVQKRGISNAIDKRKIHLFGLASALHDIGKLKIPDEVINKPGKFTKEEYDIMKEHSIKGAEMLRGIGVDIDGDLYRFAYNICRWHHERYDGSGYPDGIEGDNIPIEAQIVSIVDAYDAMTSERVYKPPMTHEEAIESIKNGECGAFNPKLIECIIETEVLQYVKSGAMRESEGDNQYSNTEYRREQLEVVDKRHKNQAFYAEMSMEIRFEYYKEKDVLYISRYGANKLGLGNIVEKPRKSDKLNAIFKNLDIKELFEEVDNTDGDENITLNRELRCDGTFGEEYRWHRIVIRKMYNEGMYTGFIGIAIDIDEETRKIEQMRISTSTEYLTGAYTREAGERIIKDEIRAKYESDGESKELALAVFDIDDFKDINNKHGHPFGDCILKDIVKKTKESIRYKDIVVRMGGDEFIILLKYDYGVQDIIERVHSQIASNYRGIDVSISMGIVTTEHIKERMTYESMYLYADKAMYSVKNNGKGSYMFYTA